ncbi:MAG: ATP-binding cassette domain-containing protein [Elusimicrobia bacterium]|nr:ATP-binding cassette domain-containing protein [Candidatus Liberimonas magnetica]
MTLLKAENLFKIFSIEGGIFRSKTGSVRALDNISLELKEAQVLGIVGESGSGKTTLGKALCGLLPVDAGSIFIDGKAINLYSRQELSTKVQMIFQDPFASLNPKLSIGTILFEAVTKDNLRPDGKIVSETLELVGLPKDILKSYPHQFSGGQRQRIAIARVLLKKPKIIIADEPLSSLDISIQNQLLNLFMKLKGQHSTAFIFISHDMVVTSNLADYILVMKDGMIVEENDARSIILSSRTDYTKKLVSSII